MECTRRLQLSEKLNSKGLTFKFLVFIPLVYQISTFVWEKRGLSRRGIFLLNSTQSSKEKRMVISLILFRCAKRFVFWGKIPQRKVTKRNTYNHSFFFTIVSIQFSRKFCFSGCLVLITNSKLVISVGKRTIWVSIL